MKTISEKDFLKQVIQLAKLCGFRVAHFRPAMTKQGWRTAVQGDGAGFPDLLLLHPRRSIIFAAELKVGKGKPTPEQTEWLEAFRATGVGAYLWTPDNWEEIEIVLKGEP